MNTWICVVEKFSTNAHNGKISYYKYHFTIKLKRAQLRKQQTTKKSSKIFWIDKKIWNYTKHRKICHKQILVYKTRGKKKEWNRSKKNCIATINDVNTNTCTGEWWKREHINTHTHKRTFRAKKNELQKNSAQFNRTTTTNVRYWLQYPTKLQVTTTTTDVDDDLREEIFPARRKH